MLGDTQKKEPKFRTISLVEINDESGGTYNASNQTKFKISMIRSNLCNYSNARILVIGTATTAGAGADNAAKGTDEKK